MEVIIKFIVVIIFIVLIFFIIRAFGAWMLRIDEVIDNQEEQTKLLNSILETILEKRKTESGETDNK